MDISGTAGSVHRGLRNVSLRRFGARLNERPTHGSSGNYGSGARLRSRDRQARSEGPAGPQTALEWHEGLANAKERIEAHERTLRNQSQLMGKMDAKIEELYTMVKA